MDEFSLVTTPIKDLLIIKQKRYVDDRGYLEVTYNSKIMLNLLGVEFVQDKVTKSARGVLRGIHYQDNFPQGKLIKVLKGKVLDVVIDLRTSSKTFGQHFKIELSGDKLEMLYLPPGVGHGLLVIEDETLFLYKTTEYYYSNYDRGIIWNDSGLNINWDLNKYQINSPILSERDKSLPQFNGEL